MKLASYREDIRKIGIQQAADEIGVAHETWRRWENGDRTPSVEMIAVLRDWSKGSVTSDDFVDPAEVERLRARVRTAA